VRRSEGLCLALLLLRGASLSCWADGERSSFTYDVGPRFLGVDAGIGYRGISLLPNVDTTIWAFVGGGYEWLSYYRDASGALVAPRELAPGGLLAGKDPVFHRIEGAWRLGVDQGLAWNERTRANLVEAFAFYRGRLDFNEIKQGQLLYDSSLADRAGVFLNSIIAGLAYDDVLPDTRHKTFSGTSAEVSAEWGPRFLLNTLKGDSDFVRFNATFRWFLPLYDQKPDEPVNFFSIYLGERFSVDYALGLSAPVPLYIRQTFGGRGDQIIGLGKAVRGVDEGSLDTNLKAVNSLEVRANLPAFVSPDVVPGFLFFWDLGYYNQVGESGFTGAAGAGVVSSAGGGIFLDLLDLARGAAYMTRRLTGVNSDGSVVSFVVEFGLHF
jgi:Omp85 superfamily domain